jgi:hypothetical protein
MPCNPNKNILLLNAHHHNHHHIALLFFANLFFCSPSSLELRNPKKLLFFFVGLGALAPGFPPDITTALALALGLTYNPLLPSLPLLLDRP